MTILDNSLKTTLTYLVRLSLDEHRIGAWVCPKLTSSNLAFRDLHWDPVEGKVLS